jgi:Icc-related predicted phosphoesterase
MRILAIGDPHGDLKSVRKIPLKNVDAILLTGDLGSARLMRKMAFENIERRKNGLPPKEFSSKDKKRAFMEAYTTSIAIMRYLSKYAPVYSIYGNVESTDRETKEYSKELGLALPSLTKICMKMKNVNIINNKLAKVKNVRIGGLQYFTDVCWVKNFKPNDYESALLNASEQSVKAHKMLSKFGKVDILVCHQPPLGYLDKVTAKFAPKHWQGKHAGSKIILDYIKRKKPRYVFCGHIHEGEGNARIGSSSVHNLGVCGWKIVEI